MLCYVSFVIVCYVMLCYVMLCYAMLCHAMLCYAMLCYAMRWYLKNVLSAPKAFFYQDHRYIRFDPMNLHVFSRWFRNLQRKYWVIWLNYCLLAKSFLSKIHDSSYKPLVNICCRGTFFCTSWTNLEPSIIDWSRFYKIIKNDITIFFDFFIKIPKHI